MAGWPGGRVAGWPGEFGLVSQVAGLAEWPGLGLAGLSPRQVGRVAGEARRFSGPVYPCPASPPRGARAVNWSSLHLQRGKVKNNVRTYSDREGITWSVYVVNGLLESDEIEPTPAFPVC